MTLFKAALAASLLWLHCSGMTTTEGVAKEHSPMLALRNSSPTADAYERRKDLEVHVSAPECVDAEVPFKLRCTLTGFQKMHMGRVQLVIRVGGDTFAVAECIASNHYSLKEYAEPYFTTNQTSCYVPKRPSFITHVDFQLALRRNWTRPLEILNGMYCYAEYVDSTATFPRNLKVGDRRYWNVSLCGMTSTKRAVKELLPTLASTNTSPSADVVNRPEVIMTAILAVAFGAGTGIVCIAASMTKASTFGLCQPKCRRHRRSVNPSDDTSDDCHSTSQALDTHAPTVYYAR